MPIIYNPHKKKGFFKVPSGGTKPSSDASFSYAEVSYAKDGSNPTPTITGDAGGTFTATPVGLNINSSTGEITLSTSTINSYTVKYTLSDGTFTNQTLGITAASFASTNSMNFDGVDDCIDPDFTTGTNDVSISFWMKSSTAVNYNDIRIAFGARPTVGGTTYTIGRTRSQFATPTQLNAEINGTFGSTVLNDGNWHNLVYTLNFTTKEVKAYVDGNTTPEATKTFPSWISNFQPFIGALPTLSNFINGNVDECALWYSVLTTSDVTTIYNSGVPNNLDDLSTPPTAWYRMGEAASWDGSKWTLVDQGSGSNNAESVNMVEADRKTDVPS